MWSRVTSAFSTLFNGILDSIFNFGWLFGLNQKVRSQSIPRLVFAFTLFILLIALGVLCYVHIWSGWVKNSELQTNPKLTFYLLIGILLFSASFAMFIASLLEEAPQKYPEIYKAWKDGLAELAAQNYFIESCPLFVFFGLPNTAAANSLMEASDLKLVIQPKNTGSQPLLWYVGEDRNGDPSIFLVLCSCCQTSFLAGGRGLEKTAAAPAAGAGATLVGNLMSMQNFSIQQFRGNKKKRPKISQASVFGDDTDSNLNVRMNQGSVSGSVTSDEAPEGTVTGDQSESSAVYSPAEGIRRLSTGTMDDLEDKLFYVCHLMKTARHPDCPCNGMVVTAPFSLLKNGGKDQALVVAETTRNDLRIMTYGLGLRSHVIAMVTGMDDDQDFSVFLRRTVEIQEMKGRSSKTYLKSRIGKGLESWVEPADDRLEQLATCACSIFENQIYNCYRATISLTKPDNGQLYRFLANVRSKLAPSLQEWLVNGFALHDDPNGEKVQPDLPLFAGCYLVATNQHSDEQRSGDSQSAFVADVFGKLIDNMGEIEWTDRALGMDRGYKMYASLMFYLTGLMFIATAVIGYLICKLNGWLG